MAKSHRLYTNFSKGELSPLLEGRSDLAAFSEGGATIENWTLLRQGGVTRRCGTRFITHAEYPNRDAILIPFERDIDNAYMIELGDGYANFFKNTKQKLAFQITTAPYTESQLRDIHFTQSVDVGYLFHGDMQQRRLSHISDTNWTLLPIIYNPPPSFENDTDLSGGTITLTPGATTGQAVNFHASAPVFLEGDVGRQIIFGSSRATITDFGASAGDVASPNDDVRADIIDDFPNVAPIAAGQWLLRLSPQATLDPDKKEPVGAQIALIAGKNSFRVADVGKFIKIYAGLIKVTVFTDVTHVKGQLLSVMTGTDLANPAASPAGAWSLEIPSWSAVTGYPATGEFYQGRLGQARTRSQPTTFWLSASDDFDSYAIGQEASRAIEDTMATKALNRIQWLSDNEDLIVGTGGSEHKVTSGRTDEPLGGDIIPLVTRITTHGDAAIQPIVVNKRVLYLDRSRRQIYALAFDWEQNGLDSIEITGGAEHITESKIRMGPWAFQKRLDPIIYMVREDGTLVTLTYHVREKVIGFTRFVTKGTFEAVCVIPGTENDQVWVLVKRTINGATVRNIELFEDNADELASRDWKSCQTDSAVLYNFGGVDTTILTGLDHLEGEIVDIIIDGSYRGQDTVVSGRIILDSPGNLNGEVGLHYDSTLRTFRPGIPGAVVEGLPRHWIDIQARLHKSYGGKLNGQPFNYPPGNMDEIELFTGDRLVDAEQDTDDTDGRITVLQDIPYPMTVLALFGEVEFGDHA